MDHFNFIFPGSQDISTVHETDNDKTHLSELTELPLHYKLFWGPNSAILIYLNNQDPPPPLNL